MTEPSSVLSRCSSSRFSRSQTPSIRRSRSRKSIRLLQPKDQFPIRCSPERNRRGSNRVAFPARVDPHRRTRVDEHPEGPVFRCYRLAALPPPRGAGPLAGWVPGRISAITKTVSDISHSVSSSRPRRRNKKRAIASSPLAASHQSSASGQRHIAGLVGL